MRSTGSSRSGVSAALTSRSGRCVVASATRRPPPTSSITGSAAPVRAARYSVWPVKGMPASLITHFCTGAVTIASNSPARAAADGAIEQGEHVARVGRVEPAGHGGRARAARAAADAGARSRRGVEVGQGTARPRGRARPSSARSPSSTSRSRAARRRKSRAEVGADAGRLAGGHGEVRSAGRRRGRAARHIRYST